MPALVPLLMRMQLLTKMAVCRGACLLQPAHPSLAAGRSALLLPARAASVHPRGPRPAGLLQALISVPTLPATLPIMDCVLLSWAQGRKGV